MLHEGDDVAAGRQVHQLLLEAHQPVVHLGGNRSRLVFLDLAQPEGVLVIFEAEKDAPTTVPALEPR